MIANLSSIWGKDEKYYSGVIAQTLAIFDSFRTHFLEKLIQHSESEISANILDQIRAIIRDDVPPINVVTEESFGDYGRVDIRLRFETLSLGIENKINAVFQKEQLIRYDEYLRGLDEAYLLILLAPSNYRVAEHEKPRGQRFTQLSYDTLRNWIDLYLKEKDDLSDLERTYLRSVQDFVGEIDMPNIQNKEMDALSAYSDGYSATRKLNAIIKRVNESIQNPYGNVENSLGNYILGYNKILDYPVYFGFRYGVGWYYAVPLIDDRCEVIVYVKDDEKNNTIAQAKNDKLRKMLPAIKKAIATECKVDFYDRKKHEECRLAIRRSLASFTTRNVNEVNVDDIKEWLKQTLKALEEQLKGFV